MPRITEDPWEVLRREIDRSRRGGHAATLLRVALDAPGRGRRGRRAVSGVIARLADNLRSVDTVWADGDIVYALLPETSQDAAEALVSRLWREAPDVLPYDGLRMACFPAHGLTANAMRAAVDARPAGAQADRPWSAVPLEPVRETESR